MCIEYVLIAEQGVGVEENTSGCAHLIWCQQPDLYFFPLMFWLSLGVKWLDILYHNQQKIHKKIRIPECPFHALRLTIRDGLIYTNLILPLEYFRR